MARPTLPTDGATPWGSVLRAAINDVSDRADAAMSGGGSPPFIVVASNDAPPAVKATATYVCDGTNDQEQINAAIDQAAPLDSRNSGMPAGAEQSGMVLLTGGRFNISGSTAIRMRTGVRLTGAGWLTELRAVACTAPGVINLAATDDHLCQVDSLYLDGNYASGGSCNGIDFDMSSSGGTAAYPDASPDSYHHIRDLFIARFTGGTRHGIYLHASGTANNRGNIITNIQARVCSGNGIYLNSASDSYISQVHVGGCDVGIRVDGGNTKVSNAKAFYCNTGMYVTSGRHTIGTCEMQDNHVGYHLAAADTVYTGLVADCSRDDGILIESSGAVLTGVQVFHRGGGRYPTGTNGIRFTGSRTDSTLIGRVNPSNITNPISGTPGARSFMRVTDGSTLNAAGD